MPRDYNHRPTWIPKGAPRLSADTVAPGSQRWNQRKAETVYRQKLLPTRILPEDTADWVVEEFGMLELLNLNDKSYRFWELVNELSRRSEQRPLRLPQQRYSAVRQRLLNEGKIVRYASGSRLLLTEAGEHRRLELQGILAPAVPTPEPQPKQTLATYCGVFGITMGSSGELPLGFHFGYR